MAARFRVTPRSAREGVHSICGPPPSSRVSSVSGVSHAKERLRTTQTAREGTRILRPIEDLSTGKSAGNTQKV